MYFSFFKKMTGQLKQLPVKKRIAAITLAVAGVTTMIGGMGPLATYAAQTSSGGNGAASIGTSYKPGGEPYGVVEPGYFAVTPISSQSSVRTGEAGANPDYTLLMEAAETNSTTFIPDQNYASLLFIPRVTWNNETGKKGNGSNYWVRDSKTNYGRDCSRYNAWLIRVNNGDKVYSSSKDAESIEFIHPPYNASKKEYYNWGLFNNIVFCELTKDMLKSGGREIGSAAVGNSFNGAGSDPGLKDTGVYRKRIYAYVKNENKTASQYGYYDLERLSGMDKSQVDEFLQYVVYGTTDSGTLKKQKINYKNLNDTLVKKSQQLWNAFTQITTEGGYYRTHVDRINVFINSSYNYAITKSDAHKYFDRKKLQSEKPLAGGTSLSLPADKIDDNNIGAFDVGYRINHIKSDIEYTATKEKLTITGKNTEDEGRCRVYCSNMYRLGYLDLLLTAYTISVNQNNVAGGKAKAASEEYWKNAIYQILSNGNGETTDFEPVWINVQMGLMSVQNTANAHSSNVQLMFAASQDSIDASYDFATINQKTKDEETANQVNTMTYPYPGYPYRVDSKGRPINGFNNIKEITIYSSALKGSSEAITTESTGYDTIATRKFSRYGLTYYDKLKKAEVQSEGYTKGYSWYSSLTINRILSKYYDGGKEYKTTDSLANIELINSRVSRPAFSNEISTHKYATKWGDSGSTKIWQKIYEENSTRAGKKQQMYGSFLVMCAPFEVFEQSDDYFFAAKLSISSELAGVENKSPNYTARYNLQKKAVNDTYPSANEVGYLGNANSAKHVFCTEKAKNSTVDNLWGVEKIDEKTGKPQNGVHPLLSDLAKEDLETLQKTLKKKENAIITKKFSNDEAGGDTTTTINDKITLDLAVQSYTNKDNKKTDDAAKWTLQRYLNKYMKDGSQAKLKVIWTIYRKNPTYKSSGKLDPYGRTLYNAEDKWLNISATSHKDKSSVNKGNEPPYYKATDIKSEIIRGSMRDDDEEEEILEEEEDPISMSGESEFIQDASDASGAVEPPLTEAEEETVEDVKNSINNGDSAPEEILNADNTDLLVSMFDVSNMEKKTYVYEDFIDEKNLAYGIKLRNFDTLVGEDINWLGQKGIYYQAEVQISFTKNEKVDGKYPTETISALSNIAGISYSWGKAPDPKELGAPPTEQIDSIPSTKAYAELKEGTIYNETFEAMAGVPSTRSLYYATGGSEFIVNLQAEYEHSTLATRTYRSLFRNVPCEYRDGDTFKGTTTQKKLEETFVADKNDKSVTTDLLAEANNMVEPEAANVGKNTTTFDHEKNTKIWATWDGKIANKTQRPSQNGANVSPSGQPCEGGSPGEVYGLSTPATDWDVTAYNKALNQAIDWAKKMEKISDDKEGSAWRIADSDGIKRVYHVGKAVIKVTLTGGTNSHGELSPSRSWGGGTFSSSDAKSSAELKSNDAGRLGSGWGLTTGKVASVSGAHTTDPKTGAVTGHSSWSGYKGSTDGKTSEISYKIEVTFKEGYTTALDGDVSGAISDTNISVAKRGGSLTQLPAHALCGSCCQHILPSIEDNWKQDCLFDTIRITNVRVWKLDSGYVNGMTEIQEGAGYSESDDYDVVVSNITQGDPNIFYNIVSTATKANEMSLNGRIRYSLQTGQDDDVVWLEQNGNFRASCCDGMAKTNGGGTYGTTDCTVNGVTYKKGTAGTKSDDCNPARVRNTGHVKSWCKGCLYTNTEATDETHGTWYMEDKQKKAGDAAKKTAYNGSGNGSVKIDVEDKLTLELRTFWMRRKTDVTATVVSDFLILQTSSGDQPIVYYEETSNVVHTEQNFTGKDANQCKDTHSEKNGAEDPAKWGSHGLVHHDVHLDKGGDADEIERMFVPGWSLMWSNNANVNKSPVVNVGSYNGKYNLPYNEATGEGNAGFNKYTGTGNHVAFATAFDNDKTYYRGSWTDDKFTMVKDEYENPFIPAKLGVVRTMTQGEDPYKSAPSCGQLRLDRHRDLILTRNNIWQNPTNSNKEYVTGQSYAFWLQILEYNTTRDWKGDAVAAKTGENQYYRDFEYNDLAFSEENETLDRTNYLHASWYQGTAAPVYTGKATNGVLEESQNQLVYGGDTHNSNYGSVPNHGHTATSAGGDTAVVNSLVKRHYGLTFGSVYADGLTKVNDIVVQDPVSVEKAYVIKQDYYDDMDQRVQVDDLAAELNKTQTKGECPGNPAECEYRILDCQYAKAQPVGAFAIDDYTKNLYNGAPEDSTDDADYGYYIKNGVKNGFGTNSETDIRGGSNKGFSIATGGETDAWLVAKGQGASLLIDWAMLSQTPVKASTYTITANVKFTGTAAGEYGLFAAGIYTVTEKGGYIYVKSKDGSVYRTMTSVPLGEEVQVGFTFTIGDVTASKITIAGADAALTLETPPASQESPSYSNGEGIFLGNRTLEEGESGLAVDMKVDNIQITREAGTHEHTNACYTTYVKHTHTHREIKRADTCLTLNEDAVRAAVEKVETPQNGDLATGESKEFTYKGKEESITLTKGTYKLEAWGASGGGNDPLSTSIGSRGGQGGYTSGIITLDSTTTLYVYVGGKGGTSTNTAYGGWNGGGNATWASTNTIGAGGGATDFRITGGEWNNVDSLKSRILVAGGGGGSDDNGDASGSYNGGNDETGGNGGGINGQAPITAGSRAGFGYGTQTGCNTSSGRAAGGFGYGGYWTGAEDYGGGGGGYYGGSSGGGGYQGGGGGSSYVSGYAGCDTTYLANQKVNGKNLEFSDVTIQQGGNTGNGKAKITAISANNVENVNGGLLETMTGEKVWPKIKDLIGEQSSDLVMHTHEDSCYTNTFKGYLHTFNNGYPESSRYNTGSCQYLGSGSNTITTTRIVTADSNYKPKITIGLHAGCLTRINNYSNFKIRINDTWMTIKDAMTNGLVVNGKGYNGDGNIYGNYSNPGGFVDGGSVYGGVWAACYAEFTLVSGTFSGVSVTCSNSANLGDGIRIMEYAREATCGKSTTFEAGAVAEYSYTGGIQQITLPSGMYKLETWGAQGGSISGYAGGYGGYSSGVLNIKKEMTLYIGVGQQGQGTNKATAYNGGGGGYCCGAGGGGATHIATSNGTLPSLSGNKDSVLIVAGGGGGASGDSPYGNGAAGGSATSSAGGAYGSGTATTSGGNAFGQGGTNTYDAAGGGGGYYGGYAAAYGYTGGWGGGGSGFANSALLSDITGTSGANAGNGKARITVLKISTGIEYDDAIRIIRENKNDLPTYVSFNGITEELNPIFTCTDDANHICENGCVPVRVLNCTEPHHTGGHYGIDNTTCWRACHNDEWHNMAMSTQKKKDENGNETEEMKSYAEDLASFIFLDNFFQVYYPSKGDFYETDAWGILSTQQQRGRGYTNDMSTTAWTREKNIIFPYSVLYNRNGVWEQHEANEWFDLELYDDDGNEIEVYDFYVQLRNSEMEHEIIQYEAESVNNQTIPSVTEGYVEDIYAIADQWRALRNAGVGGPNLPGQTVDEFTKKWSELAARITSGENARVCYIFNSDGQNNQDCPKANGWQTNKWRFSQHQGTKYFAYHSAWKCQFIDLVGRIGNLTVEDTNDLYFANLFKQSKGTSGWILDGLVKNVDPSIQNKYLIWKRNNGSYAKDVRYETVSELTGYLNTYGTSDWADFSGKSNDSGAQTSTGTRNTPASGSKNMVKALNGQNLQPGDDLLWDLTTIGNYWDGNLQIKPYFYALNVETDELIPVDVYVEESGNEKALNYFGMLDLDRESDEYQALKDALYDKAEELDWEGTSARRNYNSEEAHHTEYVTMNETEYLLDASGNMVGTFTVVEGEDGAINPMTVYAQRHLLVPYGDFYRLGNLQLLYPEGRSRTFIGDSNVIALNNANKRTTDKYQIWTMYSGMPGYSDGKDINGDNNQELGVHEEDYYKHAQRWHLTLGIDSEVTFLPYRGGKHNLPLDVVSYADGTVGQAKYELMYDPADTITNPEGMEGVKGQYVILMTADIVAMGDIYNLRYSQKNDNGTFDVNSIFYADRDGDGVGEKYEVKKSFDFGTDRYSSSGSVERNGLDYFTGSNNVSYPDQIPTLLSVYYGKSKTDVPNSVNITQSH